MLYIPDRGISGYLDSRYSHAFTSDISLLAKFVKFQVHNIQTVGCYAVRNLLTVSAVETGMAKPIPRQRKHKARARSKQNPQDDNANALELLPSTSAEQNVLRQRRRAEFQAQQPPAKLSSKKKRRLDKYIVCGLYAQRTSLAFVWKFRRR